MKNLNTMTIKSLETYDVIGPAIVLARTDKNRWYLADEKTGNLLTSGFSSEILAQEKLAKIEDRRVKGNIMGFRFGKKIAPKTVKGYAQQVWGDLFKLKNVKFDGHYWWTQVVSLETGKVSESHRADYLINYVRIPEGLETEATVARAVELGARWVD